MTTLTHSHILAIFFMACDRETANGMSWYPSAHSACRAMAGRYDLPTDTVAAVVAALSPNNRWERNLRDAEALIKAFCLGDEDDMKATKVSTYGLNKRKAIRILRGEPPLSVLGGLKVRNFFGAIMLQPGACCVDGHAFAIWKGEYIPTARTPTISAKLYAAIAADYQRAADIITTITGTAHTASQVQAVAWVVWQRIRRSLTMEAGK